MPSPLSSRTPIIALFGVVTLQAAVVATTAFLPLVDLPQHVALAQLLLHLDEPGLAQTFESQLFPQVNLLYLFLLAPAMALLGETLAVKALLIVYLAGMAGAMYLLTRRLGTSPWNAVVGMLLALHFNLIFGFMSFCMGLPILIWLLARLLQGQRGARSWIVDAMLWLLLVLAHTMVFAFGLAGLAVWTVLEAPDWRRRRIRVSATIPALLLGGAWYLNSQATLAAKFPMLFDDGSGMAVRAVWDGPGRKIASFGWSLNVAESGGGGWLVLAGLAALVIVLSLRGRRAEGGAPTARSWILSLALLALVLYAVLPAALQSGKLPTYGLFLLYQRFLVLAPLLLVSTLNWPSPGRLKTVLACAAISLHLVSAFQWSAIFERVDRDAVGLDDAIAVIPPGKIVKGLIYTRAPSGLRFDVFLHAPSYYQARQLGEVDQSFALLAVSPVRYRNSLRPYLSLGDEHLVPERFNWRAAQLYDYILIHDLERRWEEQWGRTPYPRVYDRNGWVVLKVEASEDP